MHAIVISHLGAMHHERFKKTMHPEHLDQAISLLQAAIEDITPQTDIHAECLRRLAQGYHTRYQSTSNLDDSVSAITVLSESCELTLQESNLTPLLSWLYEYVGRGDRTAKPLAKAIDHLRRVVESFTGGPTHPLFKYVASLSLLIGPLLKGRCGETEGLEELNNAISHYRIHLSFLQHFPEIPGYSQVLYEYSSLLKDRFLKSEDIADLDEAILIATEALASAPSDNTSIGLLASLYFQRYTQIQVNSDLDESILLQRRFFDSMASDDPSYDDTLDDLVKYLCTRSIASNMENDTEEALTIASNALALNYGAADQQFLYERFQAFVLHQKFLLTRNIDHLSSATKILLQSRCNTSSSTQLKSKVGNLLCDLADSYSDLHGTSHDAELLHKAVACSQKYLMISNTPDAYRQLGKSLHDRFKTSTSNDGLEVAIEALSARLRMLEEHGNEPHPALLLDLGNFIGQAALLNVDLVRYSQAKGLLQRAVLDSEGRKDLHSKALVDLIKHTSCEWFLNAESAGRASYSEFEEDLARNMDRGTILKLRSNLETAEELLLRVPIDAPDYPKGHEIVLSMRIVLAHIDGDSQSMGKVIQHIQKGRQKDPTYGHGLLMIAYQVSRDPLYRDLAIAGYRAAALDTSRETLKRFESTRVWIQIYRVDGGVQPKCLEAYEVAIGLLATVVGLGQRISDRHSQVTDTGEIANWTLQRWAARLPLEAAAKAADSR
ncbi:hypothetical protein BKA70DRAFT_1293172 [Coprinopsis sp. MPI-PUGE-AT-0042]|nr:hypothetical protein BKA70DRAFT_1293172 [Coprinopsis sp. MPI-PUGE-AT-0042]